MARIGMASLALVLVFIALVPGHSTFASASTFIEDSCKTTPYPKDCSASLTTRSANVKHDARLLAKAALSDNLAKAQALMSSMSHTVTLRGLRADEHAVLKDCLDQVDDSLDELRKSIRELRVLGTKSGPDAVFGMSNVQTWVSSVLTNHETCVDGFRRPSLIGKSKDLIGPKLEELERATRNSLALVNHVPIKD